MQHEAVLPFGKMKMGGKSFCRPFLSVKKDRKIRKTDGHRPQPASAAKMAELPSKRGQGETLSRPIFTS